MNHQLPAYSTIGKEGSAPVQVWRIWVLLTALAATIVAVFLFPPIPQSQAYHTFADRRTLVGIPNCFNVVSNLFFLLVGGLGIRSVLRRRRDTAARPSSEVEVQGDPQFIDPRERWAYFTFFLGIVLTTFGSAYYHFDPRDGTLLWDRIPMAIGFTALVAAMVNERISVKTGHRLLVPLVTLGAGSVVYWDVTQRGGHGDLRPYILVQFGSLLVIVLLMGLFPARYTRGFDLIAALAIYALAKVFEAADGPLFALGGIVSGHTLKHITAAISVYWAVRMLRLRMQNGRDKSDPTILGMRQIPRSRFMGKVRS